MELYLSDDQKSSELLPVDYRIGYGLSLMTAAQAIKLGMTAHIRIYDVGLRLGLGIMSLTAEELVYELSTCGISLSPAQAQRVLKDERLFTFAGERKTGQRGRQARTYRMVDPDILCKNLGSAIGAVNFAPKLMPVDFSTSNNYRRAITGRVLENRPKQSRQTQMRLWEVCKKTIIRWTREISEVIPQIQRRESDSHEFTMYPNPQTRRDVFLWKVYDGESSKSHKYWLEIVNDAGEIRKLPCTQDNARRWLDKSVVTICKQLPNRYRVHAAYREPPMDLPF
jgi:hypothetical protein